MKQALRIELGDRVCRSAVMENSGSGRRRIWWIVSTDILAEVGRAA